MLENLSFLPWKVEHFVAGGTFAAVGDRECTHLVVDEAVKELPTDVKLPRHVVKGEVSLVKYFNGRFIFTKIIETKNKPF